MPFARVAVPGRAPLPLSVAAGVLALAPLVVIPAQLDFAVLPQQAFVQLGALAVALAWMASAARAQVPVLRRRAFDLPVLTLLGWSAVSLMPTADRDGGLRTLLHWMACAAVYVVVSRCARLRDVPSLAAAALGGGAAVAAIGLTQALLGLSLVPQAAGPAATFSNRNLAAGYLVFVLPLALLAGSNRRSRWLAAAAAALILAYLPFTLSRTAVLAVALEAVAVAVLAFSGRRRSALRPLMAVAITGLVALALGAGIALTRRDLAKSRSIDIRVDLAASAATMAFEHPWLGVGLGRFAALYPAYGPVVRNAGGDPVSVESPHDEPLQVLAETGLPGLLALAWLAGVAVAAVSRVRRCAEAGPARTAGVLGIALLGLATDAAFGFPLRAALPPLLAAVVLGLLAALEPPRPQQVAGFSERPWLVWAAAASITLALGGALASSLLRLAADHALHAMRIAESEGRWTEALANGRAALRLDPRPAVQLAVARAELRLGHRGAALQLLHRVLALRPYDATANATLGLARWAEGDTAGAAASLRFARMLGVAPPRSSEGGTRTLPASAVGGCAPGLSVDLRPDGNVELSARNVPLNELLRCASTRTGLRLDYDGPQPRQPITFERHGEPLAAVVDALFEGLGIDYVLSLDRTGRPDRLIVFGSVRPAGASPVPAARPEEPSPWPGDSPQRSGPMDVDGVNEPGPAYQPQSPAEPAYVPYSGGGGPPAGAGSNQGSPGVPGQTTPGLEPQPGGEHQPMHPSGTMPPGMQTPGMEYPDPGQLSPTVLQLGPVPGATTADSALRYAPVTADGT